MIEESCFLSFKDNEYNFNSLSPFCKSYILNNKGKNLHSKNWDDVSSEIATYMILLFIPVLTFFVKKSVEYLQSEIESKRYETPYDYKYVDEFEELLDKKHRKIKNEEDNYSDTDVEAEYELENEDEIQNEVEVELELENKNEEKEFSQLFIEDETPNGVVGIRYNTFTESFWWWSDNKSIPFKYLETVSRKYVVEYDCLDIYVDIRDELQKGIEKANESKKKDQLDKLNDEREKNIQRVYAKFRKYNQKASRILGGQTGAYPVLKEKCNRYTYKGKMKDYEKAKEAKLPDEKVDVNLDKILKETNTKQEKLTFMEWKKLSELRAGV